MVKPINQYMKDIAEKAGLGDPGKNITNHSTHKTLVKKLKKAGVDGSNIAAITGHKTEESLRDYDENDLEDHHRLNTLISSDGSSTPKQDAISSTADSVFFTSRYVLLHSPVSLPSALARGFE